jgi:hypothetical protein
MGTSSLVLIVSGRICTILLTLRTRSFRSQMVASYNVKNWFNSLCSLRYKLLLVLNWLGPYGRRRDLLCRSLRSFETFSHPSRRRWRQILRANSAGRRPINIDGSGQEKVHNFNRIFAVRRFLFQVSDPFHWRLIQVGCDSRIWPRRPYTPSVLYRTWPEANA